MINVEKIKPNGLFTNYIYKAIPLAFDESMSYYETLCGLLDYLKNTVIPTLNNNADAIVEVQNLMQELQEYVDNYFNNLDVQEEINNKLDDLVTDGTLENLIGAYIQPRIDAQNERINQIDNKVNSATSGSPLTASSTGGMTDTNRIYVNTTDGYWYYYNGSNWVQGGVYQGINLSNKSVHYENLDDELQNSFESVEQITNYSTLTIGLVNADGTITTSSNFGYYEISVNAFDTYKLNINATSLLDSSVCIQFLNNSSVISNILKSDLTIENNYYNTIITIPYNCNKIRINTPLMPNANNSHNYINIVNKYEVNDIHKEQLDTKLQSFFQNQYEEVETSTFITNAFVSATTVNAYQSTDLLTLTVEPNCYYRFTGKQVAANPFILFLTNNKTFNKTINDNEYTINNWVEKVQSETSGNNYENLIVKIPSYCNKIYMNKFHNDSTFKVEKCVSYKINASDIVEDTNKMGFNKLIAIGDSITEVNYRALHNFLYWIKQDIPSLTIQNLGVSGTGYMRTSNTFINRINSINSYDLENDVIMVMGSVNDISFVENQLGKLGDTTTDTLYGSMYQFFNTLFTKFKGVRVGCISPINWRYTGNAKQLLTLYIKALKETCELFNVPFLDIHDKTNLRPENDTFRNTYYLADGTGNTGQIDNSGIHPNSAGHKLMYGRIKDFISKL